MAIEAMRHGSIIEIQNAGNRIFRSRVPMKINFLKKIVLFENHGQADVRYIFMSVFSCDGVVCKRSAVGTKYTHTGPMYFWGLVKVYVRYVCLRTCVCMCACVHMCVYVCVCQFVHMHGYNELLFPPTPACVHPQTGRRKHTPRPQTQNGQ